MSRGPFLKERLNSGRSKSCTMTTGFPAFRSALDTACALPPERIPDSSSLAGLRQDVTAAKTAVRAILPAAKFRSASLVLDDAHDQRPAAFVLLP